MPRSPRARAGAGPLDILDDARSPLRGEPGARVPDHYLLPELSMKGHAGAKHLQAAVDAVLTVRAGCGHEPVRRIVCRLPARLAGVVDRPPPFGSPLNALASAQFILAVAAVRGHCTPWDFTPEALADETVLALAREVTVDRGGPHRPGGAGGLGRHRRGDHRVRYGPGRARPGQGRPGRRTDRGGDHGEIRHTGRPVARGGGRG